jgi:hypothetical protein
MPSPRPESRHRPACPRTHGTRKPLGSRAQDLPRDRTLTLLGRRPRVAAPAYPASGCRSPSRCGCHTAVRAGASESLRRPSHSAMYRMRPVVTAPAITNNGRIRSSSTDTNPRGGPGLKGCRSWSQTLGWLAWHGSPIDHGRSVSDLLADFLGVPRLCELRIRRDEA